MRSGRELLELPVVVVKDPASDRHFLRSSSKMVRETMAGMRLRCDHDPRGAESGSPWRAIRTIKSGARVP